MNLRLILCAFGWHRWLYSQRGNLDGRSKTRRCEQCRTPAIDGFLMGDFFDNKRTFKPLSTLNR